MAVLGTSATTMPFDAAALYPQNPDLTALDGPFNVLEVEAAVKQLANNKASGPDGLPNEFLKLHWSDLRDDIMTIFTQFYNSDIDLKPINLANLIFIAKTETPITTSDFRPISIINIIPKLISKVLSNRLRLVLPDLISPKQTAFVHGRQISENFVTTRELLHHVGFSGAPAIFAKVDFRKAFDTIEWVFLEKVMVARGFPEKWIVWMNHIWSTSSSKVCINGDESEPFVHKRGLRQGDPLSPMMFNIAADVFQCMVQVASNLLGLSISNKISDSIVALQYADDTAIIARADPSTIVSFKLILRLFSAISGLEVNFTKSTFIPINVPNEDLLWLNQVLGFARTDFPVVYLGMPLTIKKPTRDLFIPLIEKIERRLEGKQS